ncbi:MAG: hypothetical protein ABSC05_23670 [Candidatus Solibacter sp.]
MRFELDSPTAKRGLRRMVCSFGAVLEDYLKTLRVVDAIYESARLGQAVKL